MNEYEVGMRVRLAKWVNVPPGTSKNGRITNRRYNPPYEPLHEVYLDSGVYVKGLWKSDLIVLPEIERTPDDEPT